MTIAARRVKQPRVGKPSAASCELVTTVDWPSPATVVEASQAKRARFLVTGPMAVVVSLVLAGPEMRRAVSMVATPLAAKRQSARGRQTTYVVVLLAKAGRPVPKNALQVDGLPTLRRPHARTLAMVQADPHALAM